MPIQDINSQEQISAPLSILLSSRNKPAQSDRPNGLPRTSNDASQTHAHIVPEPAHNAANVDPTQPSTANNSPSLVSKQRMRDVPPVLPLNLPPNSNAVPSHTMVTRTKDRTYKKRAYPEFVSFHVLSNSNPTSFHQANKSPQWRTAMAEEINALAKNNTWTLVPLPPDKRVIWCKWVFKTKQNADGTIERHKARLVAKGFNQISGVDFEETYSPVVRPTTIRVTMSLALTFNWPIRQLDVSNVFLNGDLNERVYMNQPPGFIDPNNPDLVCLLHKSLYGLRQAPRAWFAKLSSTLLAFGFKPCTYDPSMFIAHHHGQILILLVYVDDIIVTGSDPTQVDQCIYQLKSRFAIRDLGLLHFFLGIEATNNRNGLCLTQTKYLTDLLKRVNMMNCKPILSPMASSTSFSITDSTPCKDPHLYRSVLGALQYATLTRPDLSFAVNKLSQYMHSPSEEHWTAVKRVLRYIAGTLHYGLQFYRSSSSQIHAFSDSDWAGDTSDRWSTSGYCVFLGKNLISWCAKKQPTVSRSSTEAEYRSLVLCSQEVMWLQHLLKELGVYPKQQPILWCDNIGATFLASNPQFHAHTKHIEIDYHFVRERVQSNQLQVKFVCSKDQLADCFTKPLPLPHFEFLRSKLNVIQISSAWGGRIEYTDGYRIIGPQTTATWRLHKNKIIQDLD
jgi:Reverse transcriptase (RNA-dependent DNA polymerase)